MAISGRVPLLLLLGLVAVVLRPEAGTVLLWLLGVLVLRSASTWRSAAAPGSISLSRARAGHGAPRRPCDGRPAGHGRARSGRVAAARRVAAVRRRRPTTATACGSSPASRAS